MPKKKQANLQPQSPPTPVQCKLNFDRKDQLIHWCNPSEPSQVDDGLPTQLNLLSVEQNDDKQASLVGDERTFLVDGTSTAARMSWDTVRVEFPLP